MVDKATGATDGGSPATGEPPKAAQEIERITMHKCPECGRVVMPADRWCFCDRSRPHGRVETRPVELVAADDYERVVAERDKARYEAVCATSTVRMRRAVSDAAHQQGDSGGFGGTRKPRVAPEAVRVRLWRSHRSVMRWMAALLPRGRPGLCWFSGMSASKLQKENRDDRPSD